MDKKKSILNVSVSVGFKIATMIMALFVRRCLILNCGNDVNGLNALYISIVGILAVAELGVGSAITFCMYKPIVQGEDDKVAALYHLFRKLYLIVGFVILLAGLVTTPFIHHFAKDYSELNVDLHATFLLMLISVVITYLFGAKTALINAYKNNYVTTAINSSGLLVQYVLQIIVLRLTESFRAYLICRVVSALLQWLATDVVVWKKYDRITRRKSVVDEETMTELTRSIRAMFMHKVGVLLVNTVDSIVISTFIGVVALGEYSNYTTIMASMTSILMLVFSSLTSVFGHLYVQANKETTRNVSEGFHLLNCVLGMVFYLGYYAVADSLVVILFGDNLTVDRIISMVIATNGFVQFMRNSTLTFRDATGTFYNDRWKPPFEGLANMVLSIMFVKRIGVAGVIVATIITNLLICHVIEPYVLYRHAYGVSPISYYEKNYSMIILFGFALLTMNSILCIGLNPWRTFFANGFLSLAISVPASILVLFMNKKTVNKVYRMIKEN